VSEGSDPQGPTSWTARVREWGVRAMPPERLLPDSQPAYMSSWIYVFGVLTIAALVVIIASGFVLGLKGPAWWHYTSVGHFFNSVHLWSVELFFFCMVIHLWGKFFMAAWRGGRSRTWMSGVVTFLISIVAAFTGYVSQQNFDSQWIGTQAKDGINASGAGAFFNVLNFGQMYTYHVLLLPVVVVALVAAHILLVRRHGVVPPLPLPELAPAGATKQAAPGAR
jgi:quinol-cytochrome oxidoreductase complex cytochrome b subunit